MRRDIDYPIRVIKGRGYVMDKMVLLLLHFDLARTKGGMLAFLRCSEPTLRASLHRMLEQKRITVDTTYRPHLYTIKNG